MKRIIYSTMILLALGVVSCSKQDIRPTSATDNSVPEWQKKMSINTGNDSNTNTGTGGGSITDPNNDPESSGPVGDDN